MKRLKLIEVTWEDAHSFGAAASWDQFSEFKAIPHGIMCISCGYVISETDTHVSIVSSMNFDADTGDINQISGAMIIPRGMIRKIRILSKGDKKNGAK